MVSRIVIPSKQSLGGASPFAFTESGVAMLSGVLKSKRAKAINIAIVRAFIALRKMLIQQTEMSNEIAHLKKRVDNQEKNMELVFHYFDGFGSQQVKTERKAIGYTLKSQKK